MASIIPNYQCLIRTAKTNGVFPSSHPIKKRFVIWNDNPKLNSGLLLVCVKYCQSLKKAFEYLLKSCGNLKRDLTVKECLVIGAAGLL